MDLPYQELTGKVIAAAIAVHQELRPGLDEKLYERALCIELAERGIFFEQQPKYEATWQATDSPSRLPTQFFSVISVSSVPQW